MELQFRLPDRQERAQLLQPDGLPVTLPQTAALLAASDPAAYGRLLTATLFAEPRARTALAVARAQADTAGLSLHVGLDLSACEPEVQALRWETVQDPELQQPGWGLSERMPLSRRLARTELLPLRSPASPPRDALVALAAPVDLGQQDFSPIPVASELQRAQDALRSLRLAVLARAHGRACTLERLLDAVRGGPDILCLIAHGRRVDDEVYLWLEDESGLSAPVASTALATRLNALAPAARPALLIFAACESGAVGAGGMPLAAVGPLLAGWGFGAVLAIGGNLSYATNAVFLPALLREALRDGVIDRAVAAARGSVRDRPDWWAPILWLQLPHGQLWAPAVAQPPETPKGGGPMDLARGFAALKACLAQAAPAELAEISTLEDRLERNQRAERVFGSNEALRSERAQIVYSLNELALKHCGTSFNDLCRGAKPPL